MANAGTGMDENDREAEDAAPNETVEIAKGAEQMLQFTDNASEGTNRMSAIKVRQSKLSNNAVH